jgi:hypothetical protein
MPSWQFDADICSRWRDVGRIEAQPLARIPLRNAVISNIKHIASYKRFPANGKLCQATASGSVDEWSYV